MYSPQQFKIFDDMVNTSNIVSLHGDVLGMRLTATHY